MEDTDSGASDINLETITLPGMVHSLLKKIQQHLSILTITIPGSDEKYSSFLLEVHPQEDYLILDELLPHYALSAVRNANSLLINTTHEGAKIRFEAELLAVGNQNNIPFYRITMPRRIHYMQKRAFFRVPLSASQEVPAVIYSDDGVEIEGRVRNISFGGINIILKNAPFAFLEQGRIIENCRINFPGIPLNCQIVVKHVSNNRREHSILLGGYFTNIDQLQKRVIKQLVSTLERKYLKKVRQTDQG